MDKVNQGGCDRPLKRRFADSASDSGAEALSAAVPRKAARARCKSEVSTDDGGGHVLNASSTLTAEQLEDPSGKRAAKRNLPPPCSSQPVSCPRCGSKATKFCYYNNYDPHQPRYYCKDCQRYWTVGGVLRNVPPGSGRRKSRSAAFRDERKQASNLAQSLDAKGSAEEVALTSSADIRNTNPLGNMLMNNLGYNGVFGQGAYPQALDARTAMGPHLPAGPSVMRGLPPGAPLLPGAAYPTPPHPMLSAHYLSLLAQAQQQAVPQFPAQQRPHDQLPVQHPSIQQLSAFVQHQNSGRTADSNADASFPFPGYAHNHQGAMPSSTASGQPHLCSAPTAGTASGSDHTRFSGPRAAPSAPQVDQSECTGSQAPGAVSSLPAPSITSNPCSQPPGPRAASAGPGPLLPRPSASSCAAGHARYGEPTAADPCAAAAAGCAGLDLAAVMLKLAPLLDHVAHLAPPAGGLAERERLAQAHQLLGAYSLAQLPPQPPALEVGPPEFGLGTGPGAGPGPSDPQKLLMQAPAWGLVNPFGMPGGTPSAFAGAGGALPSARPGALPTPGHSSGRLPGCPVPGDPASTVTYSRGILDDVHRGAAPVVSLPLHHHSISPLLMHGCLASGGLEHGKLLPGGVPGLVSPQWDVGEMRGGPPAAVSAAWDAAQPLHGLDLAVNPLFALRQPSFGAGLPAGNGLNLQAAQLIGGLAHAPLSGLHQHQRPLSGMVGMGGTQYGGNGGSGTLPYDKSHMSSGPSNASHVTGMLPHLMR